MELSAILYRWEFYIFIVLYVVWKYCRRLIWIGDISNRHVFITGCDTGFGRLLTEKLDKRGVNVYAGCLQPSSIEDLKIKCSSRVKPVLVDVTNSVSIRKARDYVKEQLNGRALWAVVNNAGVPGVNLPFEWMTKEDCRKAIDVNLLGVFDVTLAFLPLIKRGKQGRVINIASIFGRVGYLLSGYTMSKHGIEGFSDGLSIELYPYNITVHTLEPGYFKTNFMNVNNACSSFEKRWKELDQDLKDSQGEEFAKKAAEFNEKYVERICSPKLHLVVEAYEHAVLAKYPKNRYVVGDDAKFLYIPLSWLPFDYQFSILFALQKLSGTQKPLPNDVVIKN